MNPYAEFDAVQDDREQQRYEREQGIEDLARYTREQLARPLSWKHKHPGWPDMKPRSHCAWFVDDNLDGDDDLEQIVHLCALLHNDNAELGRVIKQWFDAKVDEVAEREFDRDNK